VRRSGCLSNINYVRVMAFAIDHRTWKTGLPVRSAVLKPCAGRLVVGWVTTSEYLLLIVFDFFGPSSNLATLLPTPLALIFFLFALVENGSLRF
jgi:hypothetical protein